MSEQMGNRFYVGVDGGASNVSVAVVDGQNRVVFEHKHPGGANFHALGMETAVGHLEEALHQAVESLKLPLPVVFDGTVFGLAGCNFPSDETLLTEALRKSGMSPWLGNGFKVINDSQIALRAGTDDGVGLVLIAGTGSNCYGRNKQGEEARAGGIDYILSDEGSGYDIGLRTLRAVVRSLDGRNESTALQGLVFEALSVSNLEELYEAVYHQYTTKPQIASLAPLASRAAGAGDAVAQDILNHSTNELLKLVDAVLGRLNLRDETVSVVRVGSVFDSHRYITDRLMAELRRVSPKARVVEPKVSSAVGAAWMAREGR